MTAALPGPGPRRGRRWLRPLAVLGGFGLLGFLLHRTGWAQLSDAFVRIGLPSFGLVVLLGALEHLLDCEALRRAMLGRVGLWWTIASNSAGALINMVVPFEAGELAKGALLRLRSTHSRVVSGLVVWNYAWKLAKPAAVALCFLAGLALGHVFPAVMHAPVAAGVAVSFLPYLGLRLLLRQRPAERLMRLLSRLPRLQQRARGRLEQATGTAARLDGEVRDFGDHHRGAYLQVLALTFVGRLIGVAGLYVLARRLGLPTDLGSLAFLYAAQTVADYLAMIVPARIGVNEGTAYLLFRALGLDPTLALVITITTRARSLIIQGPAALWVWAHLGSPTPMSMPPPSPERDRPARD